MTAVCVAPLALAVNVTDCELLTAATVAEKLALVDPEATVTLDGTLTAALLLDKDTWKPPLDAAAVRLTVQLTDPEPVTEPLLQASELSEAVIPEAAAFFPLPFRDTVAFGADFELFAMVSVPDEAAVCFGL